MTDEEVLAEFRAAGALLEGHFILSSGRRSANYLQCARVLMSAERAGRLALAVVQKLPRELRQEIDLVVRLGVSGHRADATVELLDATLQFVDAVAGATAPPHACGEGSGRRGPGSGCRTRSSSTSGKDSSTTCWMLVCSSMCRMRNII